MVVPVKIVFSLKALVLSLSQIKLSNKYAFENDDYLIEQGDPNTT